MPIDSGPEESKHNRRTAKPNTEAAISPALREDISAAAQKIRANHKLELADGTQADEAVRLFRSIIHPSGVEERPAVAGESAGSIAAGLGALLGDAVRTGTELVAIPVTAFAQEFVSTMLGPTAKVGPGTRSATEPQHPAAAQTPSTVADAAGADAKTREMAADSDEEARLRSVFRRFMPMLVLSLNQGGTGYGIAEKVITVLGRPTYDQATRTGKDRIMAILKAEPDLWAHVEPIEDKFSRFLDEFMGYDRHVKEAQNANR